MDSAGGVGRNIAENLAWLGVAVRFLGAGDGFVAGLVAGVASGLGMEATLEVAMEVAAVVVQSHRTAIAAEDAAALRRIDQRRAQ